MKKLAVTLALAFALFAAVPAYSDDCEKHDHDHGCPVSMTEPSSLLLVGAGGLMALGFLALSWRKRIVNGQRG